MPISWLDVILIVIMLVSGFLAMVRGFTREVLSIFSWAMAALAALYLTNNLGYWSVLSPYIDNELYAKLAFGVAVFVVTLIIVSLITFRVSDSVLDSRVGALDRTLGFIFGLARGFLLVAIVFILFSALARDQPDWIKSARSFPLLQQTQVAIESLLPMNPEELLPGQDDDEAQPDAPGEGQGAPPAPEQPS
ncbi:MAG: CvpA family protein [Alphaproteobacteria bacterium]|nr:CvpA family protein [Alphaproteobacteria bacterium]